MTQESGNYMAFPFCIANNGRTSQTSSLEQHVRDELIQLILTNLGERLFLPEFGAGVRRLVFEGTDEATSGMTKAMINQAISRWLGSRVTLQDLTVSIQNETIEITIQYTVAGTEDPRILTFQRTGG